MTPLLPGIVLPPLRFYEAAVTGRANYKRPESTKKRWQAAGAESRSTGVPPPLLCWPTETQHHTWLPSIHCSPQRYPKALVSKRSSEKRAKGDKGRFRFCKCKCSFPSAHQSIWISSPLLQDAKQMFQVKTNQLLFSKQTWPLSTDYFLFHNFLLMNNRRHSFPLCHSPSPCYFYYCT